MLSLVSGFCFCTKFFGILFGGMYNVLLVATLYERRSCFLNKNVSFEAVFFLLFAVLLKCFASLKTCNCLTHVAHSFSNSTEPFPLRHNRVWFRCHLFGQCLQKMIFSQFWHRMISARLRRNGGCLSLANPLQIRLLGVRSRPR